MTSSLRAVSLGFVAFLSIHVLLSYAAPTQYDLVKRCHEGCLAKTVQEKTADLQAYISPMFDQINSVQEVKSESTRPIVAEIIDAIDSTTANVQAYIESKFPLNVVLGVNFYGSTEASTKALIDVLSDLVHTTVEGIKVSLKLVSGGEYDACVEIFASICVGLAALLQACCNLVTGLNVSLSSLDQIKAFVQMCDHLGVGDSVSFLRGSS
ncbi:hypothetical protein AAF712_006281 [Marasmius tenuissimus]|uniref:Secreted protein n=1 Tax=Marasmius tenuissimus TaxID=585030 RepID=A0ABR3A0X6_9AGAR|nr:hypothetical protein PM082_021788 [Marasmius tenuissimus]